MINKQKSKFGIGVLIGMVLGGLAGIFFAPKSGKENREAVLKKMHELVDYIEKLEIDKKVKEIFGEVTEEGKRVYLKAKKELVKKLRDLREGWEEFDKEKYLKALEEIFEDLKKETTLTAEKLLKLKESFVKDWEKIFKV